MDLSLTPDQLAFQNELREWLRDHPPPLSYHEDDPAIVFQKGRRWQKLLYEGGWSGLTWPVEYGGRGASPMERAIFDEEIASIGAPIVPGILGLSLVGPTIISMGTEAQKMRYLKPILSGDEIWCQGFSEPNSGSDLASLSTRAVLDGDHYVVNGQKIWTSFAHVADRCLLLVRTDPDAPKHKGITCLLLDMKTPGVSVRPLRMMSGDSGFNELFLNDVRIPVSNVLGTVNQGWRAAMTALMNERAYLGSGSSITIRKRLGELVKRCREVMYQGAPAAQDPLIRQKIARSYVELEVFGMTSKRSLSQIVRNGVPGPEGSILKLFWSEMNQYVSRTAYETFGPSGQLLDLDAGRWTYHYLRSRGNSIEAGTSEVMKNIIAERVLGLPKSY